MLLLCIVIKWFDGNMYIINASNENGCQIVIIIVYITLRSSKTQVVSDELVWCDYHKYNAYTGWTTKHAYSSFVLQ